MFQIFVKSYSIIFIQPQGICIVSSFNSKEQKYTPALLQILKTDNNRRG